MVYRGKSVGIREKACINSLKGNSTKTSRSMVSSRKYLSCFISQPRSFSRTFCSWILSTRRLSRNFSLDRTVIEISFSLSIRGIPSLVHWTGEMIFLKIFDLRRGIHIFLDLYRDLVRILPISNSERRYVRKMKGIKSNLDIIYNVDRYLRCL